MDRKEWFIDFAKIAGRRNLQAYAIGLIRNIICCIPNVNSQIKEIRNAIDSMYAVLNDASLPWEVASTTKKASAPTEATKEMIQINFTITLDEIESLIGCGMK